MCKWDNTSQRFLLLFCFDTTLASRQYVRFVTVVSTHHCHCIIRSLLVNFTYVWPLQSISICNVFQIPWNSNYVWKKKIDVKQFESIFRFSLPQHRISNTNSARVSEHNIYTARKNGFPFDKIQDIWHSLIYVSHTFTQTVNAVAVNG